MARLRSWSGPSTAVPGFRHAGRWSRSSTRASSGAKSGSTVATIFAFDTATTWTACALVRDGESIGERVGDARSLLAAAAELSEAAGVELDEIDALVVGTGPGSFTSLRLGLAAA